MPTNELLEVASEIEKACNQKVVELEGNGRTTGCIRTFVTGFG
jgi:hypothetical protein